MSVAGSLCEQLGRSYRESDRLLLFFFSFFAKSQREATFPVKMCCETASGESLRVRARRGSSGSRCGNLARDRESRQNELMLLNIAEPQKEKKERRRKNPVRL